MTDDIVTRLRNLNPWEDPRWPEVLREGADEIEWMLEEIQQLKHDSTIFINERSDAICENFDLREENAELRSEIERLREALRDVREVYAGSEGIPEPMTAAEGYLLRLLMEMTGIARAAFEKKETKQSTPGYEHMTPETVQAIRDTCSTPASRVGKTQSEVFKEEGTP